jgi:hypothetical protein
MKTTTTFERDNTRKPILVYGCKGGDLRNFFVDLLVADSTIQRGDMVYKDSTALGGGWKLLSTTTVGANIHQIGVIENIIVNDLSQDDNIINYDTNNDGVLELEPSDVEVLIMIGADSEMYVDSCSIRTAVGVRGIPDMQTLTTSGILSGKAKVVEFETGTGNAKTFVIK